MFNCSTMFTLSKATMCTLSIIIQVVHEQKLTNRTLKTSHRKDGIDYEKRYQEKLREAWN